MAEERVSSLSVSPLSTVSVPLSDSYSALTERQADRQKEFSLPLVRPGECPQSDLDPVKDVLLMSSDVSSAAD